MGLLAEEVLMIAMIEYLVAVDYFVVAAVVAPVAAA